MRPEWCHSTPSQSWTEKHSQGWLDKSERPLSFHSSRRSYFSHLKSFVQLSKLTFGWGNGLCTCYRQLLQTAILCACMHDQQTEAVIRCYGRATFKCYWVRMNTTVWNMNACQVGGHEMVMVLFCALILSCLELICEINKVLSYLMWSFWFTQLSQSTVEND